jgi:hypothetical protein
MERGFHSPLFPPSILSVHQRASALILRPGSGQVCVPSLEDLHEESLSLRCRRFHRRAPFDRLRAGLVKKLKREGYWVRGVDRKVQGSRGAGEHGSSGARENSP